MTSESATTATSKQPPTIGTWLFSSRSSAAASASSSGSSTISTAPPSTAQASNSPPGPAAPPPMGSPYVHYTKLTKMAVKKEMEETARASGAAPPKMMDVLKEVKRRWEALSEEERKTYEDERKAYDCEARQSMLSNLEQRDVPQALRKQFEDKIPKKPPSARQLYAKEHPLAASKSGRSAELRLEEAWSNAPQSVRERFEEEAKALQAEYQKSYKEWLTTPEYAQICKAEEAESRKREQARASEIVPQAKRPRVEKEKTPVRLSQADEEMITTPVVTVVSKGAKKKAGAPSSSSSSTTTATTGGSASASAPEISGDLLQEAEDMKMKAAFVNLAQRPEILDAKCTHREILVALKRSGGLVNPAKRALLEALDADLNRVKAVEEAASAVAAMPEGLLMATATATGMPRQ